MYAIHLPIDAGEESFREAAKAALASDLSPADLIFVQDGSDMLFEQLRLTAATAPMTAPREFVDVMRVAICHRAPDRFALLYEVLWRLKHGEPELLDRASDPVIAKLSLYVKAVRNAIHKMHAFVRFHKKQTEDGDIYVAWFEPDHFILERAAPFFADRFAGMLWIIATPIGTVRWDGKTLGYGPPQPKPEGLEDTVLDAVWQTYYRRIFNPARVNTRMMVKEMPRRYWKNMPETALIPELVETAGRRVDTMNREADKPPRFAQAAAPRAEPKASPHDTISALRARAAKCTACRLYQHATQTVFGEGPVPARLVFVGEQPGDSEDLAGHPFVGPAGHVFDRALGEAGIDRKTVYVTNAVKHFKFEPRGKRRIHAKPNAAEIKACHPWLARELGAINPAIIVALGASAAQSLMGKSVPVTAMRGRELLWADGRRGLITVHPSYLLRLQDEDSKTREYAHFVADLRSAASLASA